MAFLVAEVKPGYLLVEPNTHLGDYMKFALALAVLVLTSNAFADGYLTGVLECQSEHSSFHVTYFESAADGFGIGSEDDTMTLNGKTVTAVTSFAGDPNVIRDTPKRFSIANSEGQILIRVASKVPVDRLEDGSKVAVQVNLGGQKLSEVAVCNLKE
jgi:hypothetical protein